MSLKIIKAGLLDTIQDLGRPGFQHLGINPGGAMDKYAASAANALLGKELNDPVLEMHFPALELFFEEASIICITGADFSALLGQMPIPTYHPVFVPKNSLLKFQKPISGTRCYLSMLQPFEIKSWLNSYSTNLKIKTGGILGLPLKKNDVIPYKELTAAKASEKRKEPYILPWHSEAPDSYSNNVHCLIGNEWNHLSLDSQYDFQHSFFQITNDSDRMGYRLKGPELKSKRTLTMVSSAVAFGTVQLLPNGQLILLMADHQTTGGYPRIANVISVDLPLLAQKHGGNNVQFSFIDIETAQKKYLEQQKKLQQLQIACKFRIENWLHGAH